MKHLEPEPVLFSHGSLSSTLAARRFAAQEMLRDWDPDALLRTPDADIVDHLMALSSARAPRLQEENIVGLPVENGWRSELDFSGVRIRAERTVRRFVVPFTGEAALFAVNPDYTFLGGPSPRGAVTELAADSGELRLAFATDLGATRSGDEIRRAVRAEVGRLNDRWLARVGEMCQRHNNELKSLPEQVAARKASILAERDLESQIGFPVRRQPDAATYAVPITPRKLSGLPAPGTPFVPEPAMSQEDYEQVLQVLQSSRNQLERNPSLAAGFREEQIRDLLLVNLNTRFEGAATGETFNGNGKTDILVRVRDRNIFIGECKIWHGAKAFSAAIDQLLGYLVWRDTKAALLVFIRSGDVSNVVAKAMAAVEGHPNHKRTVDSESPDKRSDFTFAARDDATREIHLAMLPFVLPN